MPTLHTIYYNVSHKIQIYYFQSRWSRAWPSLSHRFRFLLRRKVIFILPEPSPVGSINLTKLSQLRKLGFLILWHWWWPLSSSAVLIQPDVSPDRMSDVPWLWHYNSVLLHLLTASLRSEVQNQFFVNIQAWFCQITALIFNTRKRIELCTCDQNVITWSLRCLLFVQDSGEKEEGGWRRRTEGDSEWRRPGADK